MPKNKSHWRKQLDVALKRIEECKAADDAMEKAWQDAGAGAADVVEIALTSAGVENFYREWDIARMPESSPMPSTNCCDRWSTRKQQLLTRRACEPRVLQGASRTALHL